MTIEMLEQERTLARKNGQNERLLVLNDIIANIRRKEAGKAGAKKKVELTESLIADTLVEYRKMLKDGIKQMPEGHAVRAMYEEQKLIVEEFCPAVMEDEIEIENLIVKTLYSQNIEISAKNKGKMMKALMPALRAVYADMDVAMPIIEFMIKQSEKAAKENKNEI